MNSNRRVGSLIKASREAGVRDSEDSVHFHTTSSKMLAVCLRVVVVAVFVYIFFIVAMVYSK